MVPGFCVPVYVEIGFKIQIESHQHMIEWFSQLIEKDKWWSIIIIIMNINKWLRLNELFLNKHIEFLCKDLWFKKATI